MSKNRYQSFVTLALLIAIGFSPAMAFAKNEKSNNGNKNKASVAQVQKLEYKSEKKEEKREDYREEKKDKREDKREEKKDKAEFRRESTKSCLKAFGHLIAPGFIKKNGELNPSSYCLLPFGISKKFSGWNNGTTTPDTIAPLISSITSVTGTNDVVVRWTTNEKADSTIFWSKVFPVDMNTASSSTKSDLTRDHKLTVSGLQASTTYYAVVRSKDKAGNTATSSQFSFTTKGLPTDTTVPVISSVALVVGTSTVNVAWSTNEQATSKLFYSTVSPLVLTASTTNVVASGTLSTSHSLQATGLATSTAYSFVVQSTDNSGNITNSPEFTATTTSGL